MEDGEEEKLRRRKRAKKDKKRVLNQSLPLERDLIIVVRR